MSAGPTVDADSTSVPSGTICAVLVADVESADVLGLQRGTRSAWT